MRDSLESAATAFEKAAQSLPDPCTGTPGSVAADLARDLEFETLALADRAYVLGRRARPKVEKSADELAKELANKVNANNA